MTARSRARRTREPAPAARLQPQPQWMSPEAIVLGLVAVCILLAVLGGGMLYDSHVFGSMSGPVDMRPGLMEVFAVPAVMLLAPVALGIAFWRGGAAIRPAAPTIAFGTFLLWCALSLVRSRDLAVSLSVLATVAASIVLGAITVRVARSPQAILAVALALIGAATLVSGIGINEYLATWRTGNILWRVFATFVNPDFLAGYLILVIPLTTAVVLASTNRNVTLLAAVALLLQALCLLLTQSRLGVAALAVAMLVFGGLAWRSRAVTGSARVRALLLLGLAAIVLLLGARPILKRLRESGSESYSAQFRLLTWRGTRRMVLANPVFGTGIGTFETAYPRYAVVGFTRHAHNGFLQLAAETGLPGPLFLLAGISATLAAGFAALRRSGDDRRDDGATVRRGHSIAESPLLLAALMAGMIGSVVHNLFDSDLYIPAIALTLGAVCGLTLTVSRRAAATADDRKPALGSRTRAASLAAAALLGIYALMTMGGRARAYAADGAPDMAAAADGYRAALQFEPWNAEYRLRLASLYVRENQPDEARRMYEEAIKASPSGKAYYQYGRLLQETGQPAEALGMFERAREAEPLNLRTLLALADAYKATGRAAEAEAVYRDMIRLYHSPVGAIRPTPELVDWEYGMAYLGLAEAAIQRGDLPAAESNLRDGAGILGEFWRQRTLLNAQIIVSQDVRKRTADRYEWALTQWADTLRKLGRSQEPAEIERRLAEFRAERAREQGATAP